MLHALTIITNIFENMVLDQFCLDDLNGNYQERHFALNRILCEAVQMYSSANKMIIFKTIFY